MLTIDNRWELFRDSHDMGYRIVVHKVLLLLVFTVFLIPSCSVRQKFNDRNISEKQLASYLANKPEPLQIGFQKLLLEGERNLVLNNLSIGTKALMIGEVAIARRCFDRALINIETIYAKNEKAKMARSLWYEEGMKDFKGSPYERAMANYYRGLIYLFDGDYENGRACFKSGILQDAYAEEEQFRCDFALLLYLEGFTSRLLGNEQMATKSFGEAKKLRPDFTVPDKEANLLLMVETGSSPRKVADGIGHGELKFFRGRHNTLRRVAVRVSNNVFPLYPMEDIAWQAMTRGGRPVDKIIGRQVEFRNNHETMSTNLTEVSSSVIYVTPLLSSVSDVSIGVGAGLGLLGIAEMQMAAQTRTHADTRYWPNLPDTVHLAELKLSPGSRELTFIFLDNNGKSIDEQHCTIEIGEPQARQILWKRHGEKAIIRSLVL